jgi:SWI/SNF chromatin-remodeling complex subunit SWI1
MNFDGAPHMDASAAAKQMASLNAVGLARIAKVPPGPSAAHPQLPQSGGGAGSGSYLGAMPINGHDNTSMNPYAVSPTFPNFQAPNSGAMTQQQQSSLQGNLSMGDPNMGANRQQPPAATLQHRQRNFLNGLTTVMSARNTPLPPALTGVPNAQYDPNTSPWKALEPSPTEIGAFRLAGKDVDLFRLWGLVFQAGGHAKVCLVRLHFHYHY